jgi:hypothetical protein
MIKTNESFKIIALIKEYERRKNNKEVDYNFSAKREIEMMCAIVTNISFRDVLCCFSDKHFVTQLQTWTEWFIIV